MTQLGGLSPLVTNYLLYHIPHIIYYILYSIYIHMYVYVCVYVSYFCSLSRAVRTEATRVQESIQVHLQAPPGKGDALLRWKGFLVRVLLKRCFSG